MSTIESAPPYDALLEALQVDDIVGAIKIWTAYCAVGGDCVRGYHNQMHPHLYCANMLHASLLGKAMGGEGAEQKNVIFKRKRLNSGF